jgi:T5orf172 domain
VQRPKTMWEMHELDWTFVYAIRCGRYAVKIGMARDPTARMLDLQAANPQKLILEHSQQLPYRRLAETVERRIHQAFSDRHIRGEWFRASPKQCKSAIASAVKYAFAVNEIAPHVLNQLKDREARISP